MYHIICVISKSCDVIVIYNIILTLNPQNKNKSKIKRKQKIKNKNRVYYLQF